MLPNQSISAPTAHWQGDSSRWYDFLCCSLMFAAVATVFIKYLFPVAFALAYQQPLLTHVQWDFWPLVHFWLGWSLMQRTSYALSAALLITVVEIAVSGLTLAMFFAAVPEWTIWSANWMINEALCAGIFVALWYTAWRRPEIFPNAYQPIPARVVTASQTTAHRRQDRRTG